MVWELKFRSVGLIGGLAFVIWSLSYSIGHLALDIYFILLYEKYQNEKGHHPG